MAGVKKIKPLLLSMAACDGFSLQPRGYLGSAFDLVSKKQHDFETRVRNVRLLQAIQTGRFRCGECEGDPLAHFRPRWAR